MTASCFNRKARQESVFRVPTGMFVAKWSGMGYHDRTPLGSMNVKGHPVRRLQQPTEAVHSDSTESSIPSLFGFLERERFFSLKSRCEPPTLPESLP